MWGAGCAWGLAGSEKMQRNLQPNCRVLLSGERVAKNGFQFEEFLESGDAPFAAIARHFVAAKTTTEVQPRTIDMHVACSNSLRNPAGAIEVSRRHIA